MTSLDSERLLAHAASRQSWTTPPTRPTPTTPSSFAAMPLVEPSAGDAHAAAAVERRLERDVEDEDALVAERAALP